MIDAELIDRVSERLPGLAPTILAELKPTVTAETLKTQAHIVRDKLSGQVLGVRSGALRRSIQTEAPIVDDNEVSGRVFSAGDVKYAAIHEFGGRTAAHDIVPSKAQALAFLVAGKQVFAKIVHHPGSQMPERSFMRSGLTDRAADISLALKEAAARGAGKAMTA